MNIIAQYNYLKANPNADFVPKTYIFAAKAAPGYYMAKQIIKLIWNISQELKKDKKLNEKLNVIFLRTTTYHFLRYSCQRQTSLSRSHLLVQRLQVQVT